jgi:hypothetical protein
MTARPAGKQTYPGLESTFDAIAHWIKKYRYAVGMRDEFMQCSTEDVASIARDLKMSPHELERLASKGPEAAHLLQKMLLALGVDPEAFGEKSPAVAHDLQRLCISCGEKKQCQHDLATGTAAQNYHTYCPNAFTLDALFKAK